MSRCLFSLLEPGVELCLPSRGLYECSDLRACIPLQHVCDKKAHCQDTSDEGEQCCKCVESQ